MEWQWQLLTLYLGLTEIAATEMPNRSTETTLQTEVLIVFHPCCVHGWSRVYKDTGPCCGSLKYQIVYLQIIGLAQYPNQIIVKF